MSTNTDFIEEHKHQTKAAKEGPPQMSATSLPLSQPYGKEQTNYDDGNDDEFWVFGYGSLVWKVDFPIETRITGYIKGYVRRFYQHSIDHRGTEEKPGRVVTLIPSADNEAKVFGLAYKIPNDKKEEVIRHLDFREKNGYERRTVHFYPYPENSCVLTKMICIYVATHDNKSYAGASELNDIAKQIFEAKGPSGSNIEYVFNLATAFRELFPNVNDEHLFELEQHLKKLQNKPF